MSCQMKEGSRLWDTGRATSTEQTSKPDELVLSPDTWLQVTSCDPVTSCTNIAGRNNEPASLLDLCIFFLRNLGVLAKLGYLFACLWLVRLSMSENTFVDLF